MSIHTDERKVLFEKDTYKNWQTPKWFFDLFDKKYNFEWDIGASEWSALCNKYITKKQDALSIDWPCNTSIFCNPPYSRDIYKWLLKGWAAAKGGSNVVFLVHARTDTAWFHEWASRGTIIYVRGRLKFLYHGEEKDPAPFPSVVVIFNKKHVKKYEENCIGKELDAYTLDGRRPKIKKKRVKRFPRSVKRWPR